MRLVISYSSLVRLNYIGTIQFGNLIMFDITNGNSSTINGRNNVIATFEVHLPGVHFSISTPLLLEVQDWSK